VLRKDAQTESPYTPPLLHVVSVSIYGAIADRDANESGTDHEDCPRGRGN
jgi:hypothetical protein